MSRILFINDGWDQPIESNWPEELIDWAVKNMSFNIYFFDLNPEEYDLLLTPDEYVKHSQAMDDYARNTTALGTWICDGTNPCANPDNCDHPDHM